MAAEEVYKGGYVKPDPEPEERFVLCSERILLKCRCGEKLVLLGREEDWYSEGRAVFECGCGAKLTLADRLVEDDFFNEEPRGVRKLLRGFGGPEGQ